jgi:hypothetical protein
MSSLTGMSTQKTKEIIEKNDTASGFAEGALQRHMEIGAQLIIKNKKTAGQNSKNGNPQL